MLTLIATPSTTGYLDWLSTVPALQKRCGPGTSRRTAFGWDPGVCLSPFRAGPQLRPLRPLVCPRKSSPRHHSREPSVRCVPTTRRRRLGVGRKTTTTTVFDHDSAIFHRREVREGFFSNLFWSGLKLLGLLQWHAGVLTFVMAFGPKIWTEDGA